MLEYLRNYASKRYYSFDKDTKGPDSRKVGRGTRLVFTAEGLVIGWSTARGHPLKERGYCYVPMVAFHQTLATPEGDFLEGGGHGRAIYYPRVEEAKSFRPLFRGRADHTPRGPPERRHAEGERIVRDTPTAKQVKEMYGHRCQVCSKKLKVPGGLYSESAHLRPLGKPHYGLDVKENILCLCPNHHVLLDYGSFSINDDFSLVGIGGILHVRPDHGLDPQNLSYHRAHILKRQ